MQKEPHPKALLGNSETDAMLVRRCSTCNAPNPEAARFCGDCGDALDLKSPLTLSASPAPKITAPTPSETPSFTRILSVVWKSAMSILLVIVILLFLVYVVLQASG